MKTVKALLLLLISAMLCISLLSCVIIQSPDTPSDKVTDPSTDGKSDTDTDSDIIAESDTDKASEKTEEYIPPENYGFIIRNANAYNVESDQYAALRCGSEMAFGIAESEGYLLEKYANGTLVRTDIESPDIDTSIEDPRVPHVMYSLEKDTVSYALKGFNFKSAIYIPIGGSPDSPIPESALVPGQTYYRIIEVSSVEPWGPEAVKEEWFVGQCYFYFLVTIV